MNLAAIGRLDLLEQLYGHVLIPEAVYTEIAVAGAGLPGSSEVQRLAWIETVAVLDRGLVATLEQTLDVGEAEAIACAIERRAELLLVDERAARAEAASRGLRRIGLLGVLREAKTARLIAEVRPLLDDLRTRAGFWVSQRTYEAVLADLGELPSSAS
jgi:predicted nucleic acid-binding protein